MNVHHAQFQPKQFYRELDRLLHEGEETGLGAKWFAWVVEELVRRFGDALLIQSGRVYEEQDDGGFELVHQVDAPDPGVVGVVLRPDYRPLQLLLEHGVFLFDESIEGQSPRLESRLGGMESAGLLVDSTPRRILAFGMHHGWERDDLDFTLNTLRNAINHRLDVQHLQSDFAQAAEIQGSLFPERAPKMPGFTLAAQSLPAEIVGGDFYDFLEGDPETVVLSLGDASGHGLPAALLARDVMTGLRMGTERALKLTAIIHRVNRVIARSALSTRFASLFFAELEPNGNLFYVNAGHPPALIVGQRGTRRLSIGGTILGPLDDAVFRRGWAHVDKGDTLVLYSDGVLERESPDGEMFGEEGIERVVRKNLGQPALVTLGALFDACRKFGAGKPWLDDTTAMVVTRTL
ncbi:MAG TPA: PP2C family protein-serine/threonine phosphatase [bacterium]|nr:PP2C family protein-serine/threonine phosphatase [bacterium]